MGLLWSDACGGIGNVVGADDQRDVGLREVAVDLVHLLQAVVGDVGFGEEDVHVARHASGDGMNTELNVDAFFREDVVEFADLVLGLRDGHSISRNNHHRIGGCKNPRGIFR